MNILLISPVVPPITPESRYLGIEREVWEYSRELVKSHKVSVIGHAKSVYPEGVTLLGTEPPYHYFDLELKAHQEYQYLYRTFDVIHDWSHQHLASRYVPNLPSLNIFFHAPALAQYPKAPYNIIALSQWAAREFKRVYHQEARYQYSIGIDTSVYKLSPRHRTDRFLTIGRMSPEKGNLDAVSVCATAQVPIDVVGGRGFEKTGSDPPTEYEEAIKKACDGKERKVLGEVSEEQKVKLMKDCRALLYIPPPNHPEVTSHKIQEAMCCGTPIITQQLGALPEIVTNGVNGYLCSRLDGYLKAIDEVDKLDVQSIYKETVERFDIKNVVKAYISLYESVAEGLRW